MDDLISRQAAIDALMSKTYRHTYLGQIVNIIEDLPSAQPELIEKVAYIRGFEQGRTQGMIDIKAKEVEQPYLQPTCNQLATDTISRQAVIDTLEKVAELYPWRVPGAETIFVIAAMNTLRHFGMERKTCQNSAQTVERKWRSKG